MASRIKTPTDLDEQKTLFDKFIKMLLPSWQKSCKDAGLEEPNEQGLTIQDGSYVADYVTKFGEVIKDKSWGVDSEMTYSHMKHGDLNGKGLTLWDLLDMALHADEEAGRLWRQGVMAFKGVSLLGWTPGLRKKLGLLDEEKTDQELANEETERTEITMSVAEPDWRCVVRLQARGSLLIVGQKKGVKGVNEFIAFLRKLEAQKYWTTRRSPRRSPKRRT